jgi:SCP-2 sterol transfer family
MGKPTQHAFLSPGWIAAAREIRDAYAGQVPEAPSLRMNLTVTDVPFDADTMHAHVDSSSGTFDLDEGHLDDAEVTVTSDYATTRTLFVDQDPAAAMAAFMGGKIRVQGDLAKLLALQASVPSDAGDAVKEVGEKIRTMTLP